MKKVDIRKKPKFYGMDSKYGAIQVLRERKAVVEDNFLEGKKDWKEGKRPWTEKTGQHLHWNIVQ